MGINSQSSINTIVKAANSSSLLYSASCDFEGGGGGVVPLSNPREEAMCGHLFASLLTHTIQYPTREYSYLLIP
jgi:hypothetical protein